MKRLIAVMLLLILGVVGYAGAGPFLTARSIGRAVQHGDMVSLQRDVDFDLVRASIKAQLEDYLARKMGDAGTDDRLKAVGRQVTASMTSGVVDALATPAGVGAILQGRSVVHRAMGYPVTGQPSADAQFDPLGGAQYRYESASRFVATVQNADGVPIDFVFTRDGLRWRLTDVQLPVDRLVASLVG